MNKTKYILLCKDLNSLFREVSKRDEVIPCLQSINIIKENTQYYLNSLLKLNNNFFFIKIFFNFILNLLKFFLYFFLILFSKILFKKISKNTKEIIFLSHGFSYNKINDVYFKNIKNNLKKKKVLTIYINQKNTFNKFNLKKDFINGSNLNLKKLIFIFCLVLQNFFYVLFKMFKTNLSKKNYLYLLSNVCSPTSLYNFIIVYETIQILKNTNAKYLFYTFEGFVYEKYLISILKKNNLNVNSFGYQHTGLSLYNNSILKLSSKKYLPNKILTISEKDKQRIIYKLKFHQIINIGKKLQNSNIKLNKWKILTEKKINCLILYENNFDEINNFLNNLNILSSKINFTIRSHPLFEKDLHKIKYLDKLKISAPSKNIAKDFLRNNLIIYKSSTLVFEAINYGLLPLRLKTVYFDENPLSGIMKKNEVRDINFLKNLDNIINLNNKKKINFLINTNYNSSNISLLKNIK